MIGTDWFLTTVLGGVKVQVAASDAARAREVLAEPVEPVESADDPEESCPSCVADEVEWDGTARRFAFALVALIGLPIPWKRMRCLACDHTWRPRRRR